MKKNLLTLFTILVCIGCTTKQGNVTITGNIDGLKKGTIYLQKIQDSILVSIDSVIVDGNAEFVMHTTIEEPEIHYLYLEKKDGKQFNDRVSFFAEPGEITIHTTVRHFEEDVKIVGGKNEMKFQEFKKINTRFSQRNLRILKEDFEASKQNDEETLINNDKAYKKMLTQKYLYTINFAINNKDLEVAPYITMHEVFDANIKYLDTVANSLTTSVRKSLYGQQLINYIQSRKTKEAQ